MSKAILLLDEMPNSCYGCPCMSGEEDICQATNGWTFDGKKEKPCPLIPVENLKMCGYDFEELLIFAEACKKANIKQEDLLAFIRNSESAFNYIYEKMLEHLDSKINIENK